MKEEEMKLVAAWIDRVMKEVKDFDYSSNKEERKKIKKEFQNFIKNSQELKDTADFVTRLNRIIEKAL